LTTAIVTPVASDHQQDFNLRAAILEPFKRPMVRTLVAIVALTLINLFCYHRTLNGYFLADDFVHVPNLVKVFNGHPDLLLQNFYSNWVQAQGTQFYRPFISLTLALDYSVWKANPTGYHITNFLYQVSASILLFLCTRRLFSYRNEIDAHTVGFLAGAFFAACPLHPEVVSWIIARVDSVQTTFLLASFWLYLRAKDVASRKVSQTLSFICFVIALLSKEMAITLPPTLFLLELIKSDEKNLLTKFKSAFKQTWQYWLILAVYLGIRTAALGTVSGGYAGSIGQGLSSSLYKRWFQDGSFLRVLLPLNAELPGSAHRLVRTLKLLYAISVVVLLAKMTTLLSEENLSIYCRRVLFACGWFALAMLPTYQVWNLTETLQGSRFIYLGTAPLCLLLALLIAPVQFNNRNQFKDFFNVAATALSIVFIWTFMQMTYQNNSAWAQASKGVRAFRTAVESWFKTPNAHKLVVLNIPQRYSGAHMIYNAATLSVLLRPPLTSSDLSEKVLTFEPITFGDADLLNISRLRGLIDQPDKYQFVKWDNIAQKLVPLNLVRRQTSNQQTSKSNQPTSKKIGGSEITDSRSPGNETFLVSPPIDVPSTSVDFVDIVVKTDRKPDRSDVITMGWNSIADPIFRDEHTLSKAIEASQHVRFDVSEHKNWVAGETIHQLRLQLPNHMNIGSVNLIDSSTSIPSLVPDTSVPSAKGRTVAEDVGGVSRPGPIIGPFNYDATKVTGADHLIIEISKADSWFEHYSGTYRDKKLSPETSLVLKQAGLKQDHFSTASNQLERPGFYEIRVSAVDKDGKLVGYPSDPICLQFSSEDLRK
jgi:protein O-mannosyl-transferase